MCNGVILIKLIRVTASKVSELHGTARHGM
jgi:hypothetical protein